MIRLLIVVAVYFWIGTIPALIAALWVCALWGISGEALPHISSSPQPSERED